ncbi:hypothetical protein JOD43_003084 [Pullulanibacillus pueri]|uniref:Uncharacterized protein n=1 Tax=Pullulanibacillus pueri TaxID=1437324 RepID=A0A8J2ZY85_9BACL|nr:hypothetical protein [Pullulanibacillus pueri]MBM7682905.1 hypothetical protein [Pullulanibacillus pueri]GGH84827.1 hypothetical protein GCM10007096_28810 [Pullulanibacillus pueri]
MGKRHDKEYKEYVTKLIVEEGRMATRLPLLLVSTLFRAPFVNHS